MQDIRWLLKEAETDRDKAKTQLTFALKEIAKLQAEITQLKREVETLRQTNPSNTKLLTKYVYRDRVKIVEVEVIKTVEVPIPLSEPEPEPLETLAYIHPITKKPIFRKALP